METLRSFSLMMVFVAFMSVIYYFLLPSGNISRTAKSVLSAVTLACVLIPLFSVFEGFTVFKNAYEPDGGTISPERYSYFVKQGKQAVDAVIEETVRKYTDIPYKTEIEVNISDDMSINIESVRIIFAERFEGMSDLMYELKNLLGIPPEASTEDTG